MIATLMFVCSTLMRAIRKTGVISDYHWGRARKLALIGWEQARAEKAGAAA